MGTISDLYAPNHKLCDEVFADAEAAAAEGKWDAARAATTRFTALLEKHLASEEGTLFPAFEEASGMTGGPTMVMRMEHEQMRELVAALNAAVEKKSGDDFAGAAETLLVLMQQHNMKEENILYPMCDRTLSDARLLDTIASQLGA